tara:strand:- start:2414 stop:2962 length:549 start_codon:yes stop_codon:yes gene_type:complete
MPITTSIDEFCVRATAVAQLSKANEKNERLMKMLTDTQNQLSASRRLSEELMNCLTQSQKTIQDTSRGKWKWSYNITNPHKDWIECDSIDNFSKYYDEEVDTLRNTWGESSMSRLYTVEMDTLEGKVHYYKNNKFKNIPRGLFVDSVKQMFRDDGVDDGLDLDSPSFGGRGRKSQEFSVDGL